jgi:hypothetical protein
MAIATCQGQAEGGCRGSGLNTIPNAVTNDCLYG